MSEGLQNDFKTPITKKGVVHQVRTEVILGFEKTQVKNNFGKNHFSRVAGDERSYEVA